jgi:hypothetical protein
MLHMTRGLIDDHLYSFIFLAKCTVDTEFQLNTLLLHLVGRAEMPTARANEQHLCHLTSCLTTAQNVYFSQLSILLMLH